MEGDSNGALELSMFVSNIRMEICKGLNGFVSFRMKYEKKTHNMLLIMLNPRLKDIWSFFFYWLKTRCFHCERL